jgi:hypothetical protein
MNRIRSAAFVDFDNVFSGLLELDLGAALSFAQEPGEWLERLQLVGIENSYRSFLIRRCYMNPGGWRTPAGLGTDRIYFSRYRPYFTKAGFEVIDCPSLTSKHKNAADIRICIDVLDSLNRETHYDEYVLASGDSDFAPLLQRLRSSDRRVVIMATSQTAIAYESIADQFLNEQRVIELMVGEPEATAADADDESVVARTTTAHAPRALADTSQTLSPIATFRNLVTDTLSQSEKPVNLAALGLKARAVLGPVIDGSNWFGSGGLTRAIVELAIPDIEMDGHYVWLKGRHPAPSATTPGAIELPEFIERLCRVADVPRLDSSVWPKLFDALAKYAAEHLFNLTECTRWTRDELASQGVDVGRSAIGAVVHGSRYGGCPLNHDPAPSPLDIASAYFRNTIKRAAAVSLTMTDEELKQFRDWLWPDIPDTELDEQP